MRKIIFLNKSIIGVAFFLALTQYVSAQSIPVQLVFKLGKYEAYLNPETVATSTPQSIEFSAKGGITFQLQTPYNNIEKIRILFFSSNVIHRAPTYDTTTKTLTYFRTSDEYNSYLGIIRTGPNVTIKASTDPIESLLIEASN